VHVVGQRELRVAGTLQWQRAWSSALMSMEGMHLSMEQSKEERARGQGVSEGARGSLASSHRAR
jgi:hypothetical protein